MQTKKGKKKDATRSYEHDMLLHHLLVSNLLIIASQCTQKFALRFVRLHGWTALRPLFFEKLGRVLGIVRSRSKFQAPSEGRVLCMFEGIRMLKPSAAVDTIIPGI